MWHGPRVDDGHSEDCKPPQGHLSALASQCLSLKDSELRQVGSKIGGLALTHWRFQGFLSFFQVFVFKRPGSYKYYELLESLDAFQLLYLSQ